MNYSDVLHRAWLITKRFKSIWILGFLAGGLSAAYVLLDTLFYGSSYIQVLNELGSSFGLSYQGLLSGGTPSIAGLSAILSLLVFVVSVAGAIFSVASTGALINAAEVADQGAIPKAGESLKVGFSKFWRILGITFLAMLPYFAILLVFAILVAIVAAGYAGFASLASGGSMDMTSLGTTVGFGSGILVIVLLIFTLVIFAIASFMNMWISYATVAGVAENYTVTDALGRSFRMIKKHFGVSLLMFVLLFLVALVETVLIYGFVVILIAASTISLRVIVALLGALVVAFVSSLVSVFTRSAWTLTYRRLSHIDQEVRPAQEHEYIVPSQPSTGQTPPSSDAPGADEPPNGSAL